MLQARRCLSCALLAALLAVTGACPSGPGRRSSQGEDVRFLRAWKAAPLDSREAAFHQLRRTLGFEERDSGGGDWLTAERQTSRASYLLTASHAFAEPPRPDRFVLSLSRTGGPVTSRATLLAELGQPFGTSRENQEVWWVRDSLISFNGSTLYIRSPKLTGDPLERADSPRQLKLPDLAAIENALQLKGCGAAGTGRWWSDGRTTSSISYCLRRETPQADSASVTLTRERAGAVQKLRGVRILVVTNQRPTLDPALVKELSRDLDLQESLNELNGLIQRVNAAPDTLGDLDSSPGSQLPGRRATRVTGNLVLGVTRITSAGLTSFALDLVRRSTWPVSERWSDVPQGI